MIELAGIGNYYGNLFTKEQNGKYYWIIENYDTDFDNIEEWQEIPKYLYDSLIKFKSESNS